MLGLGFVALVLTSPYRMQRIFGFMDPWSDPFGKGYQLSHALIAFGRGEWFGVGLGASVEKLFYLPEAHTDFLLAVIAEELGFAGVLVIISMFLWLLYRCYAIGRQAARLERPFAALVAQGIGVWLGVQALINMGVNMGMLPTKGLTLPLMSFGGSGPGGQLRGAGDPAAHRLGEPSIDAWSPGMRTILIMAGGTGGHVFPGLAVADFLRALGWRVVWMGAPTGMEARLVPASGYEMAWIRAVALRGKGLAAKLLLPARLLLAFWQSARAILAVKPDVVLGMGGYVAFPGGMMAALLSKPLVMHEQNSVAGLTNRVLAGLADCAWRRSRVRSRAPQW